MYNRGVWSLLVFEAEVGVWFLFISELRAFGVEFWDMKGIAIEHSFAKETLRPTIGFDTTSNFLLRLLAVVYTLSL